MRNPNTNTPTRGRVAGARGTFLINAFSPPLPPSPLIDRHTHALPVGPLYYEHGAACVEVCEQMTTTTLQLNKVKGEGRGTVQRQRHKPLLRYDEGAEKEEERRDL